MPVLQGSCEAEQVVPVGRHQVEVGLLRQQRPSRGEPLLVVGLRTHPVQGDLAPLPADVRPGDLLAVPVAGAYHLSMASSYNLIGRPPVVAVTGGRARLLVRREYLTDMEHRDIGL